VEVLGQPALAADPRFASNARRVAVRSELRAIIVEAFRALSAEEVTGRLERARIANARLNEVSDLWHHPQLAARGRWTQVQTPAGPIPALLPPGIPSDASARMDPVPALGEHTEKVLSELGYDASAISALRAAAVI
jgi:crotonobetainyl-CoA:carnitine CoA-transferase CaiB-like acyl-CoA transferase